MVMFLKKVIVDTTRKYLGLNPCKICPLLSSNFYKMFLATDIGFILMSVLMEQSLQSDHVAANLP